MPENITQTLGIDASQALAALRQLDAGYARFEDRIRSVAATLDTFNKSQSAASQNKFASGLKSTADKANDANAAIGRLTVSTGTIARILTTQLTVSIFGAFRRELVDLTKEAGEFQKQVALISTIADGASFDQIAGAARNLSDQFNIPLIEAAAGVYNALSNQVGTFGETIQFSAEAALFAKATNSSLADSVDLLSGALHSFELSASDTDRVASVFFTAIDKGRITADELANAFGRVGPAAKAAGLSIEDTAAAVATISNKGSATAESLTQLRSIISGLIKPTPAMTKALKDLGFTESTTAIKTLGFAKTLEALHDSTTGSQQALARLLPNVRGLSGELALSGDEFKTLIDNIKLMETQGREFAAKKALDATNTAAERVSKQLNLLKNELTLGVGSSALEAADGLFKVVGGAENLITTGRNLIPVIAGIGAAALAAKAGLIPLAAVLAGVGAGATIGNAIDDALTANLLKNVKALEAGNKGFLEDQQKLHADRLDAARQADQATVDSAKKALQTISLTYIAEIDQIQAGNDALVASTKHALDKIVGTRQQLVQELAQAAADSERAVKDSSLRIADLQAKQSDRDFAGKIGGLSDVQQFAQLTKRSRDFAAEAARQLATAVDPQAIDRAIKLFAKAEGTGEQAKSIADRTKNRGLESNAAQNLRRITEDQIRAEQRLQQLQRGRVPLLQQTEDKHRDIVRQITEQAQIIRKNLGAFDENGKAFSSADLAKRAANRQNAESRLAALGLGPKDFAQLATLGLGEFLTKSGAQLKRKPLQLAFDIERGTKEIEKKLEAAFSKLKISAGSIFDLGGLESVLGKFENPDQIITGMDQIVGKADEMRKAIAAAFQLDQHQATIKGEVDQLFAEIDQRGQSRNNIGGDIGQKLKEEFQTAKGALEALRGDSFITPEELQRATEAVVAYKKTADSSKTTQFATTTTTQAMGVMLDKYRQISELQRKATNVAPLSQQLAPLDQLFTNMAPKMQATADTLSTQLNPQADTMKLAFQATDTASNNVNNSLMNAKSNAEAIAGSAAATAASYQSAAAAASQIGSGGSGDSQTAAHGRHILDPKYMAGGGFVPRGMDTVPVMARAGESFINPDSTRKFFSQIQAINAGKPPIFRSQGGGTTNVGDISINVNGSGSPEQTGRTVMRKLEREFRRRN